ncbi:MAG TPA: hypothetical protein VMH26_05915 [Burkholderiales bacterium]|nr:hypothetical protein [Burkholderiales bacterium]
MDAALIALLSAIDTFICVTARIDWSLSVFWTIAPTPAAMSAALGTTTFPAPFCTISTRRFPALGTLITGLPGAGAEPVADTLGATGAADAAFEELTGACDPAAFNVVLRPVVWVGGVDVGEALTTGAPEAAEAALCTAFEAAAADALAPAATEEDSGVTGAP